MPVTSIIASKAVGFFENRLKTVRLTQDDLGFYVELLIAGAGCKDHKTLHVWEFKDTASAKLFFLSF